MSILGGLTVFISSLFIRTLRHETQLFALAAIKRYISYFLLRLHYIIYQLSRIFIAN